MKETGKLKMVSEFPKEKGKVNLMATTMEVKEIILEAAIEEYKSEEKLIGNETLYTYQLKNSAIKDLSLRWTI